MIYVFIGIVIVIAWGIYMEIKYPHSYKNCRCRDCRLIGPYIEELERIHYEKAQKKQLKKVLESQLPYRQ